MDEYLAPHSKEHYDEIIERVAGIWNDRDDLPDFDEMTRERSC